MTFSEMRRNILSDLDVARSEVIRAHGTDDLLYQEGYRDALETVASFYFRIPTSVLGAMPPYEDAWDEDGDEAAAAYLYAQVATLPARIAAMERGEM